MSSESAKRQQMGPRITVTVPPEHYEQVCPMAKGKKVSDAWTISDVVEKHIQPDTPLLAMKEAR
ncbi:MAG: hypothetical protein ACOYOL_06210 [Chthoniobacterales bacterium]